MKKYNTIINVIGENNDFNIVATHAFSPQKLVLIHDGSDEKKAYSDDIRDYYRKNFKDIEIIEETIYRLLYESLEKILFRYKDEEAVINITGSDTLVNLYIYNFSQIFTIDYAYLEVAHSEIIIYRKGKVEKINMDLYDMNIDDFISISGGKILWDNTPKYNDDKLESIYNYIIKKYDKWKKVKAIFKDRKNIEFHDYIYNRLLINTSKLEEENINSLLEFLNILKNMHYIEYKYRKNQIRLDIKSEFAKSLILISGYWLEFITYSVVKTLNNVDDLKTGVVFLWDRDVKNVKNELDILASVDSSLICISCKDSKGYDQEALNELNVYSRRISKGENIDILVSTYYPEKENVINRAKEMDINIVVFDGDVSKFKNELQKIINNKG
ncbi:Card1-like endonuclease domain-containing protein [Senegalia massiliensis]|uniref:DUF1887 family protein n=1 Tax=Senegalia massiliensis TaxID=1720316 RepID=A0A845QWK5_9CLOT|nr:DUF1887 family CARF protein [Senegalia massiliensis]NBI06169.1 DUF1887 family protein [Senegalia massiliensis]